MKHCAGESASVRSLPAATHPVQGAVTHAIEREGVVQTGQAAAGEVPDLFRSRFNDGALERAGDAAKVGSCL